MDNDELKYYRYIHTLNEIFESSIEKYEDEIRLFNEYHQIEILNIIKHI